MPFSHSEHFAYWTSDERLYIQAPLIERLTNGKGMYEWGKEGRFRQGREKGEGDVGPVA